MLPRDVLAKAIEQAQRGKLDSELQAALRELIDSDTGLSSLRRAADVLSPGASAPPWLRALGTEIFRSQFELNHAAVDVLEDLPWLSSRADPAREVERRLAKWIRFTAKPPRKSGLRGGAVFLAKGAGLLAWGRLEEQRQKDLFAANRALVDLLSRLAANRSLAERSSALELAPGTSSRLEPWLSAQRRFLGAVRAFVERYGKALTSRSAAVEALPRSPLPASHPTVSVLYVGHGQPPEIPGALEVLREPSDVADARGEVIVRLQAGDRLTPEGLAALAHPFETKEIELSYGDALRPDGSGTFKPGWSPETLWAWSYVGDTFAVRTSIAKKHGLARSKPALEWLLASNFKEAAVARVPRFVTHSAGAISSLAEPVVVEADLKRRGAGGVVKVHGALREVHLAPREGTRVSIVVPFKDKTELLEGLYASLRRHEAGLDWELILANNGSREGSTARFLASLRDPRVHVFDWNQPFNYSLLNNAGAARARGELLLFLNNDVEVQCDGWLADLAGFAQLPEVGAVGARLSYGDGSLQHAGVVVGLRGLAGHAFARWRPEYGPTPFGPPEATRNWSAVTGACLMIRKELFHRLGGFDPALAVSGGDVALCLKVRQQGLRVVCVGHVKLAHYESQSRGRDPVPRNDVLREAHLYRSLLESGDPYYHPLLSTEAAHGGPGVRVEPPLEHALRALQPWL
jgi:GT2 family glycosyltransferase